MSRSRDGDAPAVDWPGAVLVAGAVASLVFGILQAPTLGWTDPVIVGCLAVGLLLAVVFGFAEFRRRRPLLDVRLFSDPGFATGVATITVVFVATFAFFYLGMQYVQQVMGYSPLVTAVAFSPMVLPLGALSALSFWYLPRLGLRLVVFTGMLLMSAGFFCLHGIELSSSYLDLCWRFLVLSLGLGLCTAPTTSAIMGAVPDDRQGVASAINDTTREIGGALGIAVAGSVLAERYGHELRPWLTTFPEPVRRPASDSLAEAIEAAHKLGPQGHRLATLSKTAFLTAVQTSTLVLAVVIAIAAAVIGLWAPGRDGQQLRWVRRLASGRRRPQMT